MVLKGIRGVDVFQQSGFVLITGEIWALCLDLPAKCITLMPLELTWHKPTKIKSIQKSSHFRNLVFLNVPTPSPIPYKCFVWSHLWCLLLMSCGHKRSHKWLTLPGKSENSVQRRPTSDRPPTYRTQLQLVGYIMCEYGAKRSVQI
jgi:hypothetical protein